MTTNDVAAGHKWWQISAEEQNEIVRARWLLCENEDDSGRMNARMNWDTLDTASISIM